LRGLAQLIVAKAEIRAEFVSRTIEGATIHYLIALCPEHLLYSRLGHAHIGGLAFKLRLGHEFAC